MKFSIILLFFLASGCPLNKLKSKFVGNIDGEVIYEAPPHAPIPPEQYCYELRQGQDVTKLEMTVTLDSVWGAVKRFPQKQGEPNGAFVGTIYENTLLVSYQYMEEGKSHAEDQVWKISGDSIFRKITEVVKRDSAGVSVKDSDRVVFGPVLRRAPCM